MPVYLMRFSYTPETWSYNGVAMLTRTSPDVWDVYDYYYEASQQDANKKFVAAYEKASNGRPPTSWAWEGYMGVKFLAGALAKGKSIGYRRPGE